MKPRQDKILKAVIEEYSRAAKPVGSLHLSKKYNFGLSSPSIRNELARLEEAGYLTHPHTSAGRIPTDKGFRYYVDKIITEGSKLSPKVEKTIKEEWLEAKLDPRRRRVNIAAEFSLNVAFGVEGDGFYYTGFSRLLQEPEFEDRINIVAAAQILEEFCRRADNTLREFGELDNEETRVFIGSEIPFLKEEDSSLSLIVRPFKDGNEEGLTVLMGPKRMNYRRNMALLNLISELID